MAVCVPIRDVKDTTRFMEVLNGAASPVTVARNGYEAFVAMTPEVYEAMRIEAALYQSLQQAERDLEDGNVVDFDVFASNMRSRNAR